MSDKKIDLTEGEEKPHKEVSVLNKGSLIRKLGVPGLYAIGYGDIGSSIYYALGVTTLYALGAAPVAIFIGAIFFIFTALTYCELGSSIPEAGGACIFARHAFNDFWSFIAGWALLLDYVVTISISAYTVGPYLSHFIPVLQVASGKIAFAIIIIGILALVNIIGIKESAGVSLVLGIFNNITMFAIIAIGAVFLLNLPYVFSHFRLNIPDVSWSATNGNFLKGIAMAMVAYIGIESVTQLAGETKNPGKNIPKAILLISLTLIIAYFGICLVAFSAVSPHDLSTTYLEDPIAGIAKALSSELPQLSWLAGWVGLLGAIILFIAANAGLVGASRLTFAMGENFQLPRFFYSLHKRFKTPYFSILIFAGIAAFIVLEVGIARGEALKSLAELYNFGAMLSFAMAHLSLIGLRIKQQNLHRPFKIRPNIKIKGYEIPLTAVLGLIATLAVWLLVVLTKPAGRYLGFTWMAIGLVLYIAYRKKSKVPLMEKVTIEKVSLPDYKPAPAKRVLVPTKGSGNMLNLQTACKIAKDDGAELLLLYVIEIPSHLPIDTFFPKQYWEAETALDSAEAVAGEWGLPVMKKIVQARSEGEAVVDVAHKQSADLIVLEYPTARKLFDTTINYVYQNAPCRVVTVTV